MSQLEIYSEEAKKELFDGTEMKSILFGRGIKCISAKHLTVLDDLLQQENSISFGVLAHHSGRVGFTGCRATGHGLLPPNCAIPSMGRGWRP